MPVIEIQRDSDRLADHLRSYKVVIDGAVVGAIEPGESAAFDVTTGCHEIFLKVSWCRSEKITVNLTADRTEYFRCRPRANLFTDLYWITLGRHRYISLIQVKP